MTDIYDLLDEIEYFTIIDDIIFTFADDYDAAAADELRSMGYEIITVEREIGDGYFICETGFIIYAGGDRYPHFVDHLAGTKDGRYVEYEFDIHGEYELINDEIIVRKTDPEVVCPECNLIIPRGEKCPVCNSTLYFEPVSLKNEPR